MERFWPGLSKLQFLTIQAARGTAAKVMVNCKNSVPCNAATGSQRHSFRGQFCLYHKCKEFKAIPNLQSLCTDEENTPSIIFLTNEECSGLFLLPVQTEGHSTECRA